MNLRPKRHFGVRSAHDSAFPPRKTGQYIGFDKPLSTF
jgi:hypothetical protein